jgi:methylase of polypeptide subunit release factors
MPTRPRAEPLAPDPSPDRAAVAALRQDLADAGFTVEGIGGILGPVAHAALAREQVVPTELVTRGRREPVAILVRLFTLGDPVEADLVDHALPSLTAAGLVRLGLGRFEGDAVVATADLRPYGDEDHTWWVTSDLAELATRAPLAPDHVLGIGGASTTLAQWTPRTPVGRALDLGTGCGVQALHLATHARAVVATDISARALRYAALNAELNGVTWELRRGSLLEPVAGELFDLVVSNPPFVITPRERGLPTYEYRDGGAHGDHVVEHLITHVAGLLAPGGIAQLLGNWEIHGDEDWRDRVGAWARASGVDAWVVQREVQDPAQYAETWARDGGHHPATPEFARMYAAWLADFAARDVTAVGFGIVTLHRPTTARAPVVDLQDVRAPLAGPLGPTIADGIAARVWLAEHTDADLLARPWQVAGDVTMEHHVIPGEAQPRVIRLVQGGGLRHTESLDTAAAGLLSVCDGEVTAGAAITAIAALLEEPVEPLRARLVEALRRWVAAGVVRAATAASSGSSPET